MESEKAGQETGQPVAVPQRDKVVNDNFHDLCFGGRRYRIALAKRLHQSIHFSFRLWLVVFARKPCFIHAHSRNLLLLDSPLDAFA